MNGTRWILLGIKHKVQAQLWESKDWLGLGIKHEGNLNAQMGLEGLTSLIIHVVKVQLWENKDWLGIICSAGTVGKEGLTTCRNCTMYR